MFGLKWIVFHLVLSISSSIPPACGNPLTDSVSMLRQNMDTVKDYAKKLEREYNALTQKVYGLCSPCKWIKNHHEDYCDCTEFEPRQDCLAFKQVGFNATGLYRINGPQFTVIYAFCDQTTQGGGWIVFQRRHDGTGNFQQNWLGYKSGFGKLTGEFWFGNDKLHDLTKASVAPKKSHLLIDMRMKFNSNLQSSSSKTVFAACNGFGVGDEQSKYLLSVGKFHGTVATPNQLWYHNHRQFSTYDSDNDGATDENCAHKLRNVGWWFGSCYRTLLNGVYTFSGHRGEIIWDPTRREQPEFVEMKFRRIV